MKKIISLLTVLLLILCIFSSCGENESSFNLSISDGVEGTNKSSQNVDYQGDSSQKIIITATYNIETKEFDNTLSNLTTAINSNAGYVSESTVRPHTDSNSGYAKYTIRIPADKTEDFQNALCGLGNLTNYSISTDDVTLQYSKLSSTLASLNAEKTRVQALYESATELSDILQIEERLADIESEIEVTSNQLDILTNKVNYSTFYVRIDDVKEYTVPKEEPTYFEELLESFGNSFVSFANVLGEIVIVLVYLLPYAIVAGGVIVLIYFINKKNKAKKAKQKEEQQKRIHTQE